MIQKHNDVLSFDNPILPGFYPDPSLCRVKDDYYLVTSTFAYFPGVPIFHSRDLVHWQQIGHVLTRPSQLNLDGLDQSRGIYAPTIRYHQGTFYMITTNVDGNGNFIVTSENPAGPWSEPFWLKGAAGIDPSLFFDEDGKVYYTGSREIPEGPKYNGNCEIWLQELDLKTMTLTGDIYRLWQGAMRDVIWPEAPHIYKIHGYYYLMIAEGGTDFYHSVTIARSSDIIGPYKGNPANPILTHRHLGRNHPIVNTGHADLVETQNGEWWMVCLASRPYGGYYRNLGRETFLVPVRWEDGWPIVSPETGKVEYSYPLPDLPSSSSVPVPERDDFDSRQLELYWNFIRTPREDFYTLSERPGYLRLRLRPEKISDYVNPSFVGRRQQHINFEAATAMEFAPVLEGESAGMVLQQNNRFHFRMELLNKKGKTCLCLTECNNGEEKILAERSFPRPKDRLYLYVEARGQDYRFYYGCTEKEKKPLAENVNGRILSTDVADGFVGAYIGLYASSNGNPGKNMADFDWFEYRGITSQSPH
jgi:xylan 1,4-beta-xylosidase